MDLKLTQIYNRLSDSTILMATFLSSYRNWLRVAGQRIGDAPRRAPQHPIPHMISARLLLFYHPAAVCFLHARTRCSAIRCALGTRCGGGIFGAGVPVLTRLLAKHLMPPAEQSSIGGLHVTIHADASINSNLPSIQPACLVPR